MLYNNVSNDVGKEGKASLPVQKFKKSEIKASYVTKTCCETELCIEHVVDIKLMAKVPNASSFYSFRKYLTRTYSHHLHKTF